MSTDTNNPITGYIILLCNTHTELVAGVGYRLSGGWKLHGTPFIVPNGGNYQWAQAMIKYDRNVSDTRSTGSW
jgi:hypothetical protein